MAISYSFRVINVKHWTFHFLIGFLYAEKGVNVVNKNFRMKLYTIFVRG